jgi:hypothetical protein
VRLGGLSRPELRGAAERAQARRDRYAARQEHERAAAAADRLQEQQALALLLPIFAKTS